MFRLKLIATVVVAAILSVPTVNADENVEAIAERAFEILKAKNYDAAFPLMLQAAEKGDCISQGLLGTMYYEGKGCTVDYEQARFWWSSAELNGCGEPIKPFLDELNSTRIIVVDNIKYIVNDENTLTVTYMAYRNEKANYPELTNLSIPESVTYNGKSMPVVAIGKSAFCMCKGLKSVTLPKTLRSIGTQAFEKCSNILAIEIPASVQSIGDYAFDDCYNLASIQFPNSVTEMGNDVFENTKWLRDLPEGMTYLGNVAYCYKTTYQTPEKLQVSIRPGTTIIAGGCFHDNKYLTAVTLPSSIAFIGNSAFTSCYNLKSINLPDAVTYIGIWAFAFCSELNVNSLPSSLTTIGEKAFVWCKSITSVTIPRSLIKIDDGAFNSCEKLSKVTVESGNSRYDSRGNCNAIIETATNTLIAGCKSTVIPNGVTAIGKNAFENCDGLKSVVIPNTVSIIGEYAFENCDGLKSVVIPNSVTEIGYSAFSGCKNLKEVTFGNSVASIGEKAFYCCKKLKAIDLPNSLSVLGREAFCYCENLSSITFNGKLTRMGYHPFFHTLWYTSCPYGVVYFGGAAYGYMGHLSSDGAIVLREGTTCISDDCFSAYRCSGLKSITIPASVVSIGDRAFSKQEELKTITCNIIDPSKVAIGKNAFDGVPYARTLKVPSGSEERYRMTSPWSRFTIVTQ